MPAIASCRNHPFFGREAEAETEAGGGMPSQESLSTRPKFVRSEKTDRESSEREPLLWIGNEEYARPAAPLSNPS